MGWMGPGFGNSVLGDVKGIRAELGAVLRLVAVTNPFRYLSARQR